MKKLTRKDKIRAYKHAIFMIDWGAVPFICGSLIRWLVTNGNITPEQAMEDRENSTSAIIPKFFPDFIKRKPEDAGYAWFPTTPKGNDEREQLLTELIIHHQRKIKKKEKKP